MIQRTLFLSALGCVIAGLAHSQLHAGVYTFSTSSGITINDNAVATPYPLSLAVSGIPAGEVIQNVRVTLNNFQHSFPLDVAIILAGPGGKTVKLMNRAGGGTPVAGISLVLDDAAASSIPDPLVSGTYRPTYASGAEPLLGGAPAAPYFSTLAAFNALSPNATWSLYAVDQFSGDSGSIGTWTLQITTASGVPPTVEAFQATAVGGGSATLHGVVNPRGAATTAVFEYGLTKAYGNQAAITLTPNNGTSDQNVSVGLTGLIQGAVYHFRISASNPHGTTVSKDWTFGSQAGHLDLSFNPALGMITTSGPTSSSLYGYDMALQSDGKILVAGKWTALQEDVLLARYHANGTLDTTFGLVGTGLVTTNLAASGHDSAQSVLVQTDGKIVVTGYAFGTTAFSVYDFALVRYNPDGTEDTSFGVNGIVRTPISESADGSSVALQSDGKIVVTGRKQDPSGGGAVFATARYETNGALDGTFGTGGIVATDFGNGYDIPLCVAIQSDGKIVVAGYTSDGAQKSFALARYLAAGVLDSTFGSSGKVVISLSNGDDYIESVALQPDGKIVAGGPASNGADLDFALARFNIDGSLDTSFGNGGSVMTPMGTYHDELHSLALQSDGKIVATGSVNTGTAIQVGLVRFLPDGSVDATLNDEGKVLTSITAESHGRSVAIQNDGKIVVAGYTSDTTGGYDLALVRYLGDPPTPEIRFFSGADTSSPELSDGLSLVDFGTTGVGIPATRSFTVKNAGNADLHLTNLALPAGFAKEGAAFAPITLAPSATHTIYVRLLANTGQGLFSGSLSLGSDDADEAVFDIPVTGAVLNPAQIAAEAYLKASNGQANDRLGASVAVSGDTVVVGAVFEDSGVPGNPADNSATDAGAAYVYVRNPLTGAWSQQAYLKASNPGAGDNFGLSVAIDGDTIAVSARLEDSAATGINGNQNDNSATDSGAVYVFTRSGTTWTQQAYIKASNTNPEDVFGHRLALSGETLVVCAPFEDSAATGLNGNQNDNSAAFAGAAYVFTRTGTVWSQQAYLKASNTGAGDRFGTAADISGDTIVVTSGNEDSGASGVDGNQADNSVSNAGAAYVFERSGSIWSQQAYLKASNPGADDEFGLPVVISPDGNTLVVGTVFEDSNATGINGDQFNNSATDSGAIYVFSRFGPTWVQEAYLKAPNAEANDWLGNGKGLSIYGDRLVVGAANEDSNATGINGNLANNSAADSGAAYLYDRVGGQWFYRSYIKAPNTNAGDQFGYNTVIAGAPTGVRMFVTSFAEDSAATTINGNQADNSAADAGAVYVYDLSPQPEIVVEHPEGSDLSNGLSVGFVPLALGSSATETFLIKNIGGGALTGLSAVASPMTEFDVLTPAPLPSLPPGYSVPVVVRFSPVATGPRTGMLIISSNDADEYNFVVNLTGTGLDMTGPAGGTMTLSPASPLAFGAVFTINFSGWSDSSLPLTYDVLIDNGLIASHGTNPIIQAMDPGVLGTHELKGRIYDALGNMTEVIQTFMVGTSQQNWRNQYFGTTSNSGNAADAYDYDTDGLPNLLEWACGLNPTVTSPLSTPAAMNGGTIEYVYPRSVSALNAGGTFTVEWSDTLPGTSWSSTGVTEQILSDNGTLQQVKALVPAGTGGKRFVRLRVTSPP